MNSSRVSLSFVMSAACIALGQANGAAQPKPDSGSFTLIVQGGKIGTDTFKADGQGGSEADATINANGTNQKFHVSVKAKGGTVTQFGADAGGGNSFVVTVSGTSAVITVAGKSIGSPQTIKANSHPFGNFSPHLMNGILGSYDEKKGGSQAIEMVLAEGLPQGKLVSLSATLKKEGVKPHKLKTGTANLGHYTLTISAGASIEMDLIADSDHRLLMWSVPSQKYLAIRDGYEALKP